ncbi:SET domain-containing protein [Lentinula edodes]|uniref:SET domain-containing protein n=1 Tax=Lentinula edodes TaxID=5353 RepID=A0A1Q3ELJ6_LENED|nr:SET domain-containing protein [Lentinula edodes]
MIEQAQGFYSDRSMLYDDEDLGGHEPGQQQNQQTDEDGGSSESDNNLYESSEPEREDWQDEIDTEKDWDMKIVGVEVANGDEIYYEARWPGWSRSDGTTNTYHHKNDPSIKGLTRDWDNARQNKIKNLIGTVKKSNDDTALGIEIWPDNDVMSSNTRYRAQLFDEKLAITEGRLNRKRNSAVRVEYDLGEGLEREMLRLLKKEIGEEETRKMLKEYNDDEESDDDDGKDTDNEDGDNDNDENQHDRSVQRRTRSETASSRTRSTAPSTSNSASISRAQSTISSGPSGLSRSQLKNVSNVRSIPRIPQAQGSVGQVKLSAPGPSSSLIPPGRSAFSPAPPSFGPQSYDILLYVFHWVGIVEVPCIHSTHYASSSFVISLSIVYIPFGLDDKDKNIIYIEKTLGYISNDEIAYENRFFCGVIFESISAHFILILIFVLFILGTSIYHVFYICFLVILNVYYANQNNDVELGEDNARVKPNRKGKTRETRSRLQLLSLAWTEAAAQVGAASITFVNEVDEEDGPPGVGLDTDSREGEFTYLEAKPKTHLQELLEPPDPGMFLQCGCGAESDRDVDMDVNDDIDIEMLFGGTESDLDTPKGKGKAKENSDSGHIPTLQNVCDVSSLCGCQGISELVDKAGKHIRAYTDEGLFKFTSRSNPRIEVIECNQYCKCTLYECSNRIAQRPRSIPVEIFKTESETRSGSEGVDDHGGSEEPRKNKGRGWGVRCAKQNVKRGTVLGCYTGVSILELIHRQTANGLEGEYGTYVFDLDGRDPAEDDEESDPNLQMYSIDARKCGNWTRFLNHSCLPNLAVYTAVLDTIPEQNIPRLVFFALEDILKGTEMTVDYHAGNPLPKKGKARKWEEMRPQGTIASSLQDAYLHWMTSDYSSLDTAFLDAGRMNCPIILTGSHPCNIIV